MKKKKALFALMMAVLAVSLCLATSASASFVSNCTCGSGCWETDYSFEFYDDHGDMGHLHTYGTAYICTICYEEGYEYDYCEMEEHDMQQEFVYTGIGNLYELVYRCQGCGRVEE